MEAYVEHMVHKVFRYKDDHPIILIGLHVVDVGKLRRIRYIERVILVVNCQIRRNHDILLIISNINVVG